MATCKQCRRHSAQSGAVEVNAAVGLNDLQEPVQSVHHGSDSSHLIRILACARLSQRFYYSPIWIRGLELTVAFLSPTSEVTLTVDPMQPLRTLLLILGSTCVCVCLGGGGRQAPSPAQGGGGGGVCVCVCVCVCEASSCCLQKSG